MILLFQKKPHGRQGWCFQFHSLLQNIATVQQMRLQYLVVNDPEPIMTERGRELSQDRNIFRAGHQGVNTGRGMEREE